MQIEFKQKHNVAWIDLSKLSKSEPMSTNRKTASDILAWYQFFPFTESKGEHIVSYRPIVITLSIIVTDQSNP